MVDCLSWYSCYGSSRSSTKFPSKGKRTLSKRQQQVPYSLIDQSNIGCSSNDTQANQKQHNVNNNNNTTADEQNLSLHFYVFNVTRERNLHLSTSAKDKRLLVFNHISNGLHKAGLRNDDTLIYLNNTNLLKPPIAMTIDRVKSEFTALRRQGQSIQVGICRCSDRSALNNTTIKHLGALTRGEFENLSGENRKPSSTVYTESKKLLHLFSNKKKSVSHSNRDSGFAETDADQSLVSTSHKHRSKISSSKSDEDGSVITQKSSATIQPANQSNKIRCSPPQVLEKHHPIPTQIVTDACCVYRREIVRPACSTAMILRGREIAFEAAHSPAIPSSMPNYTHDQVRELYGELDQKTRRLQENEYILHTPMIDAWEETSPWLEECPLPKFRLEKDEPTVPLSAYLSTGLSNNPRPIIQSNDKESIRGSFRTSIADRTSITPSPLIFNIHLDFEKVRPTSPEKSSHVPAAIPTLAKISELLDLDNFIDLDEETTVPYQKAEETNSSVVADRSSHNDRISTHEENLPIENLIRIVRAIHHYHFVYDDMNDKEPAEISTAKPTNEGIDIEHSDFLYAKGNDDAQFEDLYERYMTNLDQYETIIQRLDQFEHKADLLTPISEESVTLVEHLQEHQPLKNNSTDKFSLTFTCKRQADHIGHYGFELEQAGNGTIQISSIPNANYCPDLKIGDEILSINNHSSLKTLEQCHLLLHSLWYKQHDHVQVSVRAARIPSIAIHSVSPAMSLQSSSLSWPLSIAESEPQNNI